SYQGTALKFSKRRLLIQTRRPMDGTCETATRTGGSTMMLVQAHRLIRCDACNDHPTLSAEAAIISRRFGLASLSRTADSKISLSA
ncbi:MAG: hypothetical protein NTV19_00225, partial [Burkholderiales bacterium]|nr:hypothetical protein [Burkholderiales bacterium]